MNKDRIWTEFEKLGRYTDNCVVCNKYLKTIGEREQLMCIDCDEKTEQISQEQLREDLKKHGL